MTSYSLSYLFSMLFSLWRSTSLSVLTTRLLPASPLHIMASTGKQRDIVIIGTSSPSRRSAHLIPPRRRHHRLHNSLLPNPPPHIRPFHPQYYNTGGDFYRLGSLGEIRWSASFMGIPFLHRPFILQTARRSCSRTWRGKEMGI